MADNSDSNWEEKELGSMLKIKHGYAFKGEFFSDDGEFIVLTPGNFFDEGGFRHKENKEKYYLGPIPPEFVLKKGDLLIVMTEQAEGLLGSAAFIPKNNRYLHNQRLGLITQCNPNHSDRRFLYYLFNSKVVRQKIRASASGTKVRHTSPSRIYEIKQKIPSIISQHKIAAILSTYDDLIEKNTRRIKILEEMAQAIYREWFVHFHFPGHEGVRIVESEMGLIPEGWEVCQLGDQLAALETGKRPKGGAIGFEGGVPSIGAENVNGIGKHDFSSEKYVPSNFFSQMRQGIIQNGDVAIYKDGAYIGRSSYFRDSFPYSKCCVNEHVFLLRSNNVKLTQNILYLWLQEHETLEAIRSTNSNAAQPGINREGLNGIELILPPIKLAKQFDNIVEPILAKIINHAKHNQNLRRTRDLLLPRLISGELDVSELEIMIPEAMT